ncbi:MAG TPA: hypothetical protein VGD56_03995 [Gemmatirosa sp.]
MPDAAHPVLPDTLSPGGRRSAPGGRHYGCGPMQTVFLADGGETGDRYAVSLW